MERQENIYVLASGHGYMVLMITMMMKMMMMYDECGGSSRIGQYIRCAYPRRLLKTYAKEAFTIIRRII